LSLTITALPDKRKISPQLSRNVGSQHCEALNYKNHRHNLLENNSLL
jgi:hypothetical protein